MKVNRSEKIQPKQVPITVRIDLELARRLRMVTNRRGWPPAPTQQALVAHGIELALRELDKQQQK